MKRIRKIYSRHRVGWVVEQKDDKGRWQIVKFCRTEKAARKQRDER